MTAAAAGLKSCPLAGVILAPVQHGMINHGGAVQVQPIIPPCLKDGCQWFDEEKKECMAVLTMKKFLEVKQ